MKRPLAVSGLGVLAAIGLAVGLATGGSADATIAHGTTGGGHAPVTICHKPGTPAEQTLVVDDDAVWGHLHHGDHLGTCNPPPPVDVCPNIAGDQGTIPAGLVKDAQGNCVENETETTPTETTPTETTPPADRCPPGMTPTAGKDGKSGDDECEYPTTTATDTTPTTATDTTPTTATDTTPTTATDTTPTTTTDTTPTTTTDTTPTTTPPAPFTPPPTTTTTKPAAKRPAVTKTAPTTPKKAVAGAFAQEQPKLAYTP